MRKILLVLLLVALVAIFGGLVISGISIGNLRIGYSIQEIIDENDDLDTAISSLNSKIETEYKGAQTNLDSSFKKLQSEKQNYKNTIAYTTAEELEAANKTEQYRLDYLWATIGLYATKHNVAMRADVSYGTSGVSNQYNISFTAKGEYIAISEFIYEIEKDPNLGFRIEEFTMVPYSQEGGLQATFIIKNVAIDPNSLSSSANVSSGAVTNNTTRTTSGTSTTGTTSSAGADAGTSTSGS